MIFYHTAFALAKQIFPWVLTVEKRPKVFYTVEITVRGCVWVCDYSKIFWHMKKVDDLSDNGQKVLDEVQRDWIEKLFPS